MKVSVEIDETQYGLLCAPQEVQPLMKALSELYGLIWAEACYDPYSTATQELCQRMLPHIKQANTILKFKK